MKTPQPAPFLPSGATPPPSPSTPWLFSRDVDLLAFGGSAGLALLLVLVGAQAGWLEQTVPLWIWALAVLGVDVAHVHSTWFRVYLEPTELRRRPQLYLGLPVLCYAAGVALHAHSSATFWTALAYVAVFHFVRQPFGWVALYRARAGDRSRGDAWLDGATIYAASLWPLLWWHTQLPRQYAWFVAEDFVPGLDARWASYSFPLYAGLLSLFLLRQLQRFVADGIWNPGKILVVVTTALTWYVGIVALNSDLAFTLTNVLPHGIPYMVLVWYHVRRTQNPARGGVTATVWREGAWLYLLLLVGIAYLEELVWDRGVWHERSGLFGSSWEVDAWLTWLVPLLALPQLTHYVLDGFIWRRRSNPELARQLEGAAPTPQLARDGRA